MPIVLSPIPPPKPRRWTVLQNLIALDSCLSLSFFCSVFTITEGEYSAARCRTLSVVFTHVKCTPIMDFFANSFHYPLTSFSQRRCRTSSGAQYCPFRLSSSVIPRLSMHDNVLIPYVPSPPQELHRHHTQDSP